MISWQSACGVQVKVSKLYNNCILRGAIEVSRKTQKGPTFRQPSQLPTFLLYRHTVAADGLTTESLVVGKISSQNDFFFSDNDWRKIYGKDLKYCPIIRLCSPSKGMRSNLRSSRTGVRTNAVVVLMDPGYLSCHCCHSLGSCQCNRAHIHKTVLFLLKLTIALPKWYFPKLIDSPN